jgi:cytochrome c
MSRMLRVLLVACGVVVCGVASASAVAAGSPEQVEAGRRAFVRCVGCHTLDPQESQRLGPHLGGIVGRRAASVEGYAYTPFMRRQTFTWTRKQLDRWLKQPQKVLPDVCMPFGGIENAKERKALIAYLENGVP